MDDAAGPSMMQQDVDRARHTLTVHQVAQQLADAGVPRSERRIKHFCQIGTLVAKKFPTPTGPQWFIDPASVPGVIGDLKQFAEQIQSRLQQAATDAATDKPEPELDTAAAGSSTLKQAAADKHIAAGPQRDGGMTQPAASPYVMQLEKRIDEKDDVINLLRGELAHRNEEIIRRNERERETNILIRGLQNLVLQLQPGRARAADVLDNDPMTQREEEGVDNSTPPMR